MYQIIYISGNEVLVKEEGNVISFPSKMKDIFPEAKPGDSSYINGTTYGGWKVNKKTIPGCSWVPLRVLGGIRSPNPKILHAVTGMRITRELGYSNRPCYMALTMSNNGKTICYDCLIGNQKISRVEIVGGIFCGEANSGYESEEVKDGREFVTDVNTTISKEVNTSPSLKDIEEYVKDFPYEACLMAKGIYGEERFSESFNEKDLTKEEWINLSEGIWGSKKAKEIIGRL